jgi:PEP-CTERM motif
MPRPKRIISTALFCLLVTLAFGNRALADNMTISCTPTCVSFGLALGVDSNNPVFTVSNTGPTGLTGSSPGIDLLGVFLPEPTSLNSWTGGIGAIPTPSGTGIPGYTSGNFFNVIGETGGDVEFSALKSLSTVAGASLTSYNLFVFNLGAFDASGTVLGPFSDSGFNGASGFPVGTVFFTWLVEDTSSGYVVVNESTVVVVTPEATSTPEPSSFTMLGVGLLGLAGLTLKKSM